MVGAHAEVNLFSGYSGMHKNSGSQSREHNNLLSWKNHLRANLLFERRNFCSRSVSRNNEVEVVTHVWASVEVLDGLGCQHGVGNTDLGIGVPKEHSRQDVHLFYHILPIVSQVLRVSGYLYVNSTCNG